jgi:mono/diheme cytochrome c family protein
MIAHATSILVLLSITLALTMSSATAQDGNASNGERLVRASCIRCHAVEPGASSQDPGAPNLAAVARMPSATDLSLRVFLASSHRSMPNLVLDAGAVTDVIAYIRSLAR